MRSMRSLAMMAIVSIMAPPTVRAFMAAPHPAGACAHRLAAEKLVELGLPQAGRRR